MTNPILPDHGVTLGADLPPLGLVGRKPIPVKVVEHPAFKSHRGRGAVGHPVSVVRLPIVSLDSPAPTPGTARFATILVVGAI